MSRIKSQHRKYLAISASIIIVAIFGLIVSSVSSDPEFKAVYVKIDPQQLDQLNPDFRLFKTENFWTFLLLDTRKGHLWRVQFSVKSKKQVFKVPINETDLRPRSSALRAGRFTLYPTQNFYNFILLDQDNGNVFQCQYGDHRFIRKIEWAHPDSIVSSKDTKSATTPSDKPYKSKIPKSTDYLFEGLED